MASGLTGCSGQAPELVDTSLSDFDEFRAVKEFEGTIDEYLVAYRQCFAAAGFDAKVVDDREDLAFASISPPEDLPEEQMAAYNEASFECYYEVGAYGKNRTVDQLTQMWQATRDQYVCLSNEGWEMPDVPSLQQYLDDQANLISAREHIPREDRKEALLLCPDFWL